MVMPTYPGVYVEEVSSGVRPITAASTSTAAFVGQAERGSTEEAVKIYNFTQYQNLYGGFIEGSFLTHAVYQFFNNGGAQCYVVRVAGEEVKTATVDLVDATSQTSLTISAISPGAWGNQLKVKVTTDSTNDPDYDPNRFNLYVYEGQENSPSEAFEEVSIAPSSPRFVKTATRNSTYIKVEVAQDAKVPQVGESTLTGGEDDVILDLAAEQTAHPEKFFQRLDDKEDVSLIAVPGVPGLIGAGMNYCANRSLSDGFFIGDLAKDVTKEDDAKSAVASITPKNSYGAVYLPWLQMLDPTGRSPEPIAVPPSGYIAGMYAKTDAQRGVWKAPAGTSAALAGTVGLTVNFTDVQQGNLNPKNINCIRQFSSSGIVIWGARTITSDAEWRYIPVRRMAIMLRVSIYRDIQWAVFEPNDEELWSQLRLNINAFMTTLYRRGAFQGSTAKQAFFVKCDSETTTQIDIDNGIVNVLVGFAPLKPAEFVMVKISQKAGQTA